MAYTTPKTWNASLVTVAEFNTYIRDNQIALKDPPSATYSNWSISINTTSTSFVLIDAAFTGSITTTGGRVLITVTGRALLGGTGQIAYFAPVIDGVLQGDSGEGVYRHPAESGSATHGFSFSFWSDALSAAAHTITLHWKTNTGTLTLQGLQVMYREVS